MEPIIRPIPTELDDLSRQPVEHPALESKSGEGDRDRREPERRDDRRADYKPRPVMPMGYPQPSWMGGQQASACIS